MMDSFINIEPDNHPDFDEDCYNVLFRNNKVRGMAKIFLEKGTPDPEAIIIEMFKDPA